MKKLFCCLLTLALCSPAFSEEPPPAEYPYPETPPARATLNVEQPIANDGKGGLIYSTEINHKGKKPYRGVEQPIEISDDGSYLYKTGDNERSDVNRAYGNVEKPKEKDSEGAYYYSRPEKKTLPKKVYGPRPSKVSTDGSYIYDLAKNETTNVLFVRGGIFGPPNIQPSTEGGQGYEQVYGNSNTFMLNIEYDWQLWRDVALKVGSGISVANGNGQFVGGNTDLTPNENFSFFVFPNTVNLSYKAEIWPDQWVTPYVDGGLGYFTFMENRSDGGSTKFGGAFVANAAVGLLLSLDTFSSGTTLFTDYGITQSWLDLQFRQVFGLDARKDFTSNMITGGFAVGF